MVGSPHQQRASRFSISFRADKSCQLEALLEAAVMQRHSYPYPPK